MVAVSTQNEEDLVCQALQGDRNAFSELVLRHYRGMVSIVYRMCGDVHLAEDTTQEAFIKAWLNLSSYRKGSSLRNWLYRIAVNQALDNLRREKSVWIDEQELLEKPDPAQNVEVSLLKGERVQQVRQAVLTLPAACRGVLVLREYEGLSYQEIATILDIPVGTVMSRLNYARSRLREMLELQRMEV